MIDRWINIGLLVTTFLLLGINSTMVYQNYQKLNPPVPVCERSFFEPWF